MFLDLKPRNPDDISFNILAFVFSKPVEPDRLFDCLPNSLRPSAAGQQNGGGGKSHSEKQSGDTVTFTLPTLIPPRVLPLLHELAIQMVQAGHQQQLFRVYT
jgi:exocyst complex protein 7